MDEYCPSTLRFVLSIPLISLESMGITFLISSNFNSAFKFVGGTAPTLSTAANAVDRIDYVIKASNEIHCAVSLDVK